MIFEAINIYVVKQIYSFSINNITEYVLSRRESCESNRWQCWILCSAILLRRKALRSNDKVSVMICHRGALRS